jgi:phosphoribosylformylglycinamidine cyclo-ligase
VHSNGFSLVRQIVAASGLSWTDKAPFSSPESPGATLAHALMTPTRIYVRAVLALHRAGLLKAAAHITGGGLPGNLPRVLPARCGAVIGQPWPIPPVFAWLQRAGGATSDEMLRVFNCGIGMALVVGDADADAAIQLLEGQGERVTRIGVVEQVTGQPGLRITLPDGWLS